MKRLSVGNLLKIILALFSAAVLMLLSSQTWDAWSVLKDSQRAERVVAASRQIFTALVNQRPDRATVPRLWDAEAAPTPQMKTYLSGLQRSRNAGVGREHCLAGVAGIRRQG